MTSSESLSSRWRKLSKNFHSGLSIEKSTFADFFKNDVATDKYAMVGFILANTLSDNGSVNRGICQTDENGYLTDVAYVVDLKNNIELILI